MFQLARKYNDKKKTPLTLLPIIAEIFSKINMDAVGPLLASKSGKKYITVLCVPLTQPEAVAMADISFPIVDSFLQIFSHIDFPKVCSNFDQGTSFVSALTVEFLGIKFVRSSIHHPQSNPVERFHRTLKRILCVVCIETASEWESYLLAALFAIRTVTHKSTCVTPAELAHGKNLRTPVTLLYEKWLEPEKNSNNVVEYVFRLINRMKRCQ
ncbi:reverse transcriptase [Caerostris extrusa]|uniref:Reverse transcriptase n=1 Tax=Caerostris extrusa TaxID=172846 RepID=A0AAV4P0H8_CAEEX|nr:reverse transcriptase [Caerostris extrusa]